MLSKKILTILIVFLLASIGATTVYVYKNHVLYEGKTAREWAQSNQEINTACKKLAQEVLHEDESQQKIDDCFDDVNNKYANKLKNISESENVITTADAQMVIDLVQSEKELCLERYK